MVRSATTDNNVQPSTERDENLATVLVRIPREQHKAMKIEAIEIGQTLQVYASNLLAEGFARGSVRYRPRSK